MSFNMRVQIHPCTKIVSYISTLIICIWIILGGMFYDETLSARKNTDEEIYPRIRFKRSQTVINDEHNANEIPPIIHQTWKSDVIPLLFKKWMLSWLSRNRDWEYWFWTDEDVRTLISIRFPQFLEQFDNYPPGGYRPDVFRYFVLYEFGGVYADLDMECLRSLDPLVWQHECVLSQEPLEHAHFLSHMEPPVVSNAFMACKPRHNFFRFVIANLPEYVRYVDDNNVLKATGPYMLTEVYQAYQKQVYLLTTKGQLYIGSPDEFHPQVDESMLDSMREDCIPSSDKIPKKMDADSIERHRKLCAKLLDRSFDNKPKEGVSYSVHYWTHSWAGPKHDPWNIYNTKDNFHVDELEEFSDNYPQ